MTEEQKKWFDKLVEIRTYLANALDLSAAKGVQNTVVEKYSDQAHFIYELLQNADDARAIKAEFKLTKEGLYFKHNGSIHFTISQPDTSEDKKIEIRDKFKGNLGHINSICSIGNSAKNIESNTIGKFGVGFKAVFQYTETPHIYDLNFQFRIDRFIIPVKLDDDLADRQEDETVFYFPFNKAEMSAEKAHSDILEKLKKLVFPTLFLSNLQTVKWKADNDTGEYTKESNNQKHTDDITYEKLELHQQIGQQQTTEKLYLFSRSTTDNHKYSIGIFLDEKNKLTPKQYSAFCFFPTKETTNLNFIIHAPFLLTESRESIKRSENHNTEMVKLLAQLAADSMLILKELKLIDDDVFKIIPYKKTEIGNLFSPFFDRIKKKFETEEILPTINGYTEKEKAYWAQDNPVLNLFSDEQLALLIHKKDAKWVLRNLVRNQTVKGDELRDYIENCTYAFFEMSKLLGCIDSTFIENQSKEWLDTLYEYLWKNSSYWSDVKIKPIFLNSEQKAVPAFEKMGGDFHEILFFPSEDFDSSSKTIHPDLLKNENSKKFIEKFGIKKFSMKDEIYNNILPLYEKDGDIDTEAHFKKFFTYWKNEGRPEEFINLIKDKSFILCKSKCDEKANRNNAKRKLFSNNFAEKYFLDDEVDIDSTKEESFILCKSNNNEKIYRGIASKIYYPTPELLEYFALKTDTMFVHLEDYHRFIKDDKEKIILREFLLKLGVEESPKIFVNKKEECVVYEKYKNLKLTYFSEYTLDGASFILDKPNFETSKLLWNFLKEVSENLKGKAEFRSHQDAPAPNIQYNYISESEKRFQNEKWLFSTTCKPVAPIDITFEQLHDDYKQKNLHIDLLKVFLKFKESEILTPEKRIFEMFDSEADAKLAKKLLDEYKTKLKSIATNSLVNEHSSDFNDEFYQTSKSPKIIKDLDNLPNQITPNQKVNKKESQATHTSLEKKFDEAEELAKGIEELKKQLEVKKNRVDLAESINNNVKYSYDWFKAYLQLLTIYGEKQDTQKQKSISFQKIKPYKADNKYFLLCGASSYISSEIENADDFKVSFVFGNGKRENITVEGVSKKGQDLLIYCREPLSSNTLARLSNIFKVEINFTPVIDLLNRLYKAFTNDNNIDEWENVQEAIPSLNFIYGPPGTGKTTTLCNKINDILAENPNAKFLVLTPTNKVADVVCKKLRGINADIYAVRLSSPTDPKLEEYRIYRDTLDNDAIQSIDVVASTIHRLPYFDINEISLLSQYAWDYVIFDESSMIGLHYITFAIMALFKSNPNTNFIVAGDPKQIPPVLEIDEGELENFDFQDENIYKMMNLESFNPKEQIIREVDTIQNLDKQYRSIPQIGQLFSELSYSSLLKHDRATNRNETKQLPEKLRALISSSVTFIDIPLNRDNSIYKVNKLFYSSYHTYCAILVSEIIKYFDTNNEGEQWTIGLIAPYKAQAILLNKLITSYGISENVKVFSDTVHGFQGDECDIVFFVCNPNNYFYSRHEKALLSKEYIYNVAISRAKDYLIVLHPYSAIQNNTYINKLGLSYKNNFGNSKILQSSDIEELLFNDKCYIENNSYVSGHDNVNVFGFSEMKYFIKANDTAIDIQLRDLKEHKINDLTKEINVGQTNSTSPNGGLKIVGKIDLSKFDQYKK